MQVICTPSKVGGISLFLIIDSARPEGLKDGPEKPAASDYYSEGHSQGETIEQVWSLLLRAVLLPVHLSAAIHTHKYTHRVQSHAACFWSVCLWNGHWIFYHSRCSPVNYVPLQLREGARGLLRLPSGESLSWNQGKGRRVSLLRCAFERGTRFSQKRVTQRWEGVADIPESFPIKMCTLVVEPACWHVYMSTRWQPN